jgi:hypothetical protein
MIPMIGKSLIGAAPYAGHAGIRGAANISEIFGGLWIKGLMSALFIIGDLVCVAVSIRLEDSL